MKSTDWMEDGLCRGLNPDLWFPPQDNPNVSGYYSFGKILCDRCPVWQQCLDQGIEEVWGMWGGLTPNERKAVNGSNKGLKAHGTTTRYRQGCTCHKCKQAGEEVLPYVNPALFPTSEDRSFSLSELKVRLMKALS